MFAEVDFNVQNLKDKPIKLVVGVMNQRGAVIRGKSTGFRSPNTGQLVASADFNPLDEAVRFRRGRVFIPYSEFSVGRGVQNLRLHVDVIHGEGQNLHLTYFDFTRRF